MTVPPEPATWRNWDLSRRCRFVAAARHEITANADALIDACRTAQRIDPVETLTGELFPLCAALKFIGQRGPRLLRPRKLGVGGRPVWLWGVRSEVHREPLGDVLILAAWNYPLLLPGVQLAQALAAGNHVWLKPAPGCEPATQLLVEAFFRAGVPAEAIGLMPADPQSAIDRIDSGVDLVVLTGGSATGRNVLHRCAAKLTPAIMELSGCDALVVGPGADLDLIARAVAFGLKFNGGATCIGPRRILVAADQQAALVERLRVHLEPLAAQVVHPAARAAAASMLTDALRRGATAIVGDPGGTPAATELVSLRPTVLTGVAADWPIASADLFAPLASVLRADTDPERIALINRCPYRLAVSLFGDAAWASRLAERLDVGHVSINDLIFPTSDPRVPFGGCGDSGFGVTRGAEGLLAMTRPKVIARHRGRLYNHLRARRESDQTTLLSFLKLTHGHRWWTR